MSPVGCMDDIRSKDVKAYMDIHIHYTQTMDDVFGPYRHFMMTQLKSPLLERTITFILNGMYNQRISWQARYSKNKLDSCYCFIIHIIFTRKYHFLLRALYRTIIKYNNITHYILVLTSFVCLVICLEHYYLTFE